MACADIRTGEAFLSSTLAHIDCQAQAIGSFGYAALGAPGSPLSQALTAMLAIFVAIFGLRLLLGYDTGGRDVVAGFLKIGIVLAIATNWPAFRTVIYDTVFEGPAELAATIGGASGLPGTNAGFAGRLENVDRGVLNLTALGSGRFQNASQTLPGQSAMDPYREIAVEDDSAFGWGRVAWLSGTIGSLAVVRVAAGLLLALAPLFAALLLFAATRPIFFGWLRGLGLTALASLAVTLTLAVEVAILEPWLRHALNVRLAGYATPAAPTELLVLTLAFAFALFALIAIMARVAFSGGVVTIREGRNEWARHAEAGPPTAERQARSGQTTGETSRAWRLVEGIEAAQRRERTDSATGLAGGARRAMPGTAPAAGEAMRAAPQTPLGSRFRRTYRRMSRAGAARDGSR